MNILVTGSNGQLGQELSEASDGSVNAYFFTNHKTLDITDEDKTRRFIKSNKIDYVINCAAYTQVDKAETDTVNAYNINYKAVENLSNICAELECRLIHISTDYVFDGTANTPYRTFHATIPKTIYGKSKLYGEEAIRKSGCEYMIVRTSWLYSRFGNNFVKTMIKLFREKESMKVVHDQISSPTNAKDLAYFLLYVIENDLFKTGIYHFANKGIASWYDLAYHIMSLGWEDEFKCTMENIIPCRSCDFPTPAKRPHYSVLDTTSIKEVFGYEIPYWEDTLVAVLEEIKYKIDR